MVSNLPSFFSQIKLLVCNSIDCLMEINLCGHITFIQRRSNVDVTSYVPTLKRRCINVMCLPACFCSCLLGQKGEKV